jgi:hypothetical protein
MEASTSIVFWVEGEIVSKLYPDRKLLDYCRLSIGDGGSVFDHRLPTQVSSVLGQRLLCSYTMADSPCT